MLFSKNTKQKKPDLLSFKTPFKTEFIVTVPFIFHHINFNESLNGFGRFLNAIACIIIYNIRGWCGVDEMYRYSCLLRLPPY